MEMINIVSNSPLITICGRNGVFFFFNNRPEGVLIGLKIRSVQPTGRLNLVLTGHLYISALEQN